MVIDAVTIEFKRTGEKATLVCQGRPYGLKLSITLPELEHFALYLADHVGRWRDDELNKTEEAGAHTEPPASGSVTV